MTNRAARLLRHLSPNAAFSTKLPHWTDTFNPNKEIFSLPWDTTSIAPPPGYLVTVPAPSDQKQTPKLFEKLRIRGLTLKNRIGVSPMCQYTSVNGYMNDWHLMHLGSFAASGAGLVIQEATAVCPEGRISPNDAGIYLQEHIHMLKRIANFVHSQDCAFGIQLAHAGRKASTPVPWHKPAADKHDELLIPEEEGGWPQAVKGPSPIPWAPGWIVPKQMSVDDIRASLRDWEVATQRCIEVGYDVIEIHAAHGYLISSFLSPLSNQRTDEYGGSFENRARYLLEVVKVVRNAWPQDKPLFVRLSCTEWVEGGWNSDDTVKLVGKLKELQVDLIDCSSGGNNHAQRIQLGPGYQVPFSEAVKREYQDSMLTATVGLITSGKQAEEILQKGQADFILLAREFLRDIRFPLTAAKDIGVKVSYCPQAQRAGHIPRETTWGKTHANR